MSKVKLELNEPLEGALKYARGKHYDSTIPGKGGSMMYSLASGDVIFLDEDICDEPDELFAGAHVGAGVPFNLTLRKRNGQRYYELRRLSDAAEPARHTPAPAPPSKLESQLAASIDHVKAQRTPTPSKVTPAATERSQGSTQQVNHSAAHMMAAALISAIDAGVLAQQYAASKGFELQFFAEDYRAIAATLYIQACKDPLFAERAAANGGAQQWRQ
jgi:hypothetical protein